VLSETKAEGGSQLQQLDVVDLLLTVRVPFTPNPFRSLVFLVAPGEVTHLVEAKRKERKVSSVISSSSPFYLSLPPSFPLAISRSFNPKPPFPP